MINGINIWKTNFIGLNIPPKVLSGNATTALPYQYWRYSNTPSITSTTDPQGDPWFAYSSSPKPYQWIVSISSITQIDHGSNLTRYPKIYNGIDVNVGDFIAGAQDAIVCLIVSVLTKTETDITVLVEDLSRYNTFKNSQGEGIFQVSGDIVIFNINELGNPLLDPIPGTASVRFASQIISRFSYLNPLTNVILYKENNNFQQGDAICIENEEFVLSGPNNVSKFVGTVVTPGPGPNQFVLRPGNGIIDFVPSLPGVVGDYLYPSLDGSGDLTLDDASRRPVMMKIANSIRTYIFGNILNPVGTPGEIIEINRVQMTITDGSLNSVVSLINASTNLHKTTAIAVNESVSATSTTSIYGVPGLKYKSSAPYPSAIINGVEVFFKYNMWSWIEYGDLSFISAKDLRDSINEASIYYIEASVNNNGELVLTNKSGGSITIVNGNPDNDGNYFAGPNSGTGLPLSTPANTTDTALQLVRLDGGPINVYDINGLYFTLTAGIVSGQNGRYALGLNIEQGLRASLNSVVADIMARDALYPLVGDSCYVIDSDDGNGNYVNQWSTWLYNGSVWTLTGRQSQSTVAAKTIQYQLTNTTTQNFNIGTIVTGTRVVSVTVEVTTAFGASAQLELGYSIANPLTPVTVGGGLMTSSLIDLSRTGMYVTTGDLLFGTNTVTGDVTFTGTYLSGGSSTGVARILISYV